jgi:hypothetical protein
VSREPVEEFEHHGIRIKIFQDESSESPRSWDNLGTMVCFYKRYNLGDKDHGYNSSNYNGWEELAEAIQENENAAIILPLYLYDHSGITISTGAFSCPWDSGQVGFIFVSKEKLRKEYGKRITKKVLETATKCLQNEVNTYDQFLTGAVYGYIVQKGEEGEEDSCWGFFGLDYVREEAKSVAEYIAYKLEKEKAGRSVYMSV